MTCPKHISTRILVLSDTHSALPDPVNKPDLRFSHGFPEADVAIHCGDLTSCGKLHEHERALALLRSLPAPIKIVIPGNHDLTLDSVYLRGNRYLHGWNRPHNAQDSEDALALYTSCEAKEAGIKYVVEGLHTFVLPNGAKLAIYASAFTPEFCNWGFAYPRSYDRFNVIDGNIPENPIPSFRESSDADKSQSSQVTVMVTHGPPQGILDKTIHGESVGCDHLLTAVNRCRPLLHCFGHIHEAWGAEIRSWSDKANNGAIVNLAAAKLRAPNTLTGMASHGDDTASPVAEVQLGVRSEASKGLISHPAESFEDDALRRDEESQTVSIIDARTIKHGEQTVFVNASIMDVRYVPRQWSWLVHLRLPEASEEKSMES